MNVKQEFDSVKGLVMHILEKYPETRANDTLLYLRCCEKKGCRSIDDIEDLNLSIISVHKTRQQIQNKFKQYLPDESTIKVRKTRQKEIREYMIN
jgi:hypothetical protein